MVGWDDYGTTHDIWVVDDVVSAELKWDFKAEWLERKRRHDAQRAYPTWRAVL